MVTRQPHLLVGVSPLESPRTSASADDLSIPKSVDIRKSRDSRKNRFTAPTESSSPCSPKTLGTGLCGQTSTGSRNPAEGRSSGDASLSIRARVRRKYRIKPEAK